MFHPLYKEPIILRSHSPLVHFLDRIRDEAHRFAVTYHKKIRGRETIKSVLEEIPGIGRARRNGLIRHSSEVLKKVKEAAVEDLIGAPKMDLRSSADRL